MRASASRVKGFSQREPFCYNPRLNRAKGSDSTYLDQSERDESGDPEDFSVDG